VEHKYRVVKWQFGFVKVRYRCLKKNTALLFTLFALSNLWIVQAKLKGVGVSVRPKARMVHCQGQQPPNQQ
jgi:IS5 family transposase